MKVSLNQIKQFLDFELPGVDELVRRIGAQLGEIEGVIDLRARYKNVIIVKVVECGKLENSDHLNICQIDDGGVIKDVERNENGLVQVLTGAPNVHKDMLAVWLSPGSTVPESYDKGPFVLTSRMMRGAMSHGMLASSRELAIGDAHEGILEIYPGTDLPDGRNIKPGESFAETFCLDDTIIDVENKMFTHRPDCFGVLGVAREIAGIMGRSFTSPDWYKPDAAKPQTANGEQLPLAVANDLPELVPRFMAVSLADVKVQPSPIWLQVALAKIGQKPVNNVVDITNFMMQLTAQPLHAYDYDKVKNFTNDDGAKLIVRNPKNGEKIKLLNGKEITPRDEAIVIATDKQLAGIGGVMGGSETEVDANTKNIILECATFDMYSIRKTSMAHGLFTDAVTRYTKGQSTLQNPAVLAETVNMISRLTGAMVACNTIDNHDNLPQLQPVRVSDEFVSRRLGAELDDTAISSMLNNVEFRSAMDHDTDELILTPPFWRTDIEIPEDIVEEVGRLYGYDKLSPNLPERSIKPASKNALLELKSRIRESLSKAGANEVLTYSFVHGKLLERVGQDKSHAFQLANALSPDLQYYRLSLLPSLLEKVHGNIKAGYDEFALFEIGKGHIKNQLDDDKLPREDELTALVIAAGDKLKKTGAAYYQAKQFLQNLVGAKLTYQTVPEAMQSYDITKPFDQKRTAFIYAGETFIGLVGEFRVEVRRNLKLPKYVAGFELDTVALGKVMGRTSYVELPKYPKVEQDISLKVGAEVKYQDLYDCVWDALAKAQPERTLPTLGPLDIFQREDDKTHKQIAFRFTIASYDRTLKSEEVSTMLDQVAAAAKARFSAERI